MSSAALASASVSSDLDLPPGQALGGLVHPVLPIDPDVRVLAVYARFSDDPRLYALAVVDDGGRPVGIVNRFKFLEQLSRPFGRDLVRHRPVRELMDAEPLIVDEQTPLDHLSAQLLDDGSKYIFDGFIVTRDGRYMGIGTGFSLIRHLTERRQAVLFHMAHHDGLTGLPNRQLFAERLGRALARARREATVVGVLYLDVDRLKAVNDQLGHALGDALLKGVAGRLQARTRETDTVARLSGDEYAVVLGDLNDPDHAQAIARELLDSLRETHRLGDEDVNVSCSIGVAVYPNDGTTQPALLRAADIALYEAKQFRNTCVRFTSDIQRSHTSTLLLSYASVRKALDEGQLEVFYQPQVAMGSRQVVGLEALVRWHHPQRGALPTSDLIRLAEDAGLITAVTEYVLRTALRAVTAWKCLPGLEALTLAVNVSGIELRDGTLVEIVRRELEQTGFPPDDLELEITETTVMLAGTATGDALESLTGLGVQLSIDDFGTGYSSLARLQRLPVRALKIDRSFVEGIGRDDSGALAQTIILLAHSLGLTVTAEGVETEAQAAFLERHACDRLQGYLLARPMPFRACTDLLSGRRPHADDGRP